MLCFSLVHRKAAAIAIVSKQKERLLIWSQTVISDKIESCKNYD